jgi:hypothetical protein
MEFLVCMLLASIITGGRTASNIIHAVKGTTPPHVERARLKAQQKPQPKGRSPYADGKPRMRDVAAAFWGDALADAIDLHNRRREAKRERREQPQTEATRRSKDHQGFLAQLLDLILNGRPRQAQAPEAAQGVADTRTPAEGPRIACDECGATLVTRGGGWNHPDGSTCPKAIPAALTHGWSCHRCGGHRDGYPDEDAAARGGQAHIDERHDGQGTLKHIDQSIPDHADENLTGPQPVDAARWNRAAGEQPATEGDPMTDANTAGTATGDAHDVESALHECGLLDDDLTRIDTSLDVIDEAITSAAAAAERIEAFLASKNVDDSAVGGMATARDALSPDRIKELMDAVAAAKQGVKDAVAELERLQELESQLAGADGSVLNGR